MFSYPIYDVRNFNCHTIHDELYVNTFREHLRSHAFVEEPHRHNSYLLLFFTKGSGTHEVDFDQYEIKPGRLFPLQPGQLHHWNLSKDTDGFVIIYSGELYDLRFANRKLSDFPFYQSAQSKPEITLAANEIQSVLPYFKLLVAESQIAVPDRDKMLNLLDCIHIEIARQYESESHHTHPYNLKIKQFESLLEQHFHQEKGPSFYAEKCNITLKHLNRICQEILEKTATDVIAARVILEIKRMLAGPQFSINEIADALGFDDYSYFSRFFKKQTGLSPTDFRKYKILQS